MRTEEINEGRLKHLEMIQATILKMGNNSFLIKGWNITLVSGILFLSIQYQNKNLGLLALAVNFMFWHYNAYFLNLEKLFRKLWDKKIKEPQNMPTDFSMDTKQFGSNISFFKDSFRSHSLESFYGIAIVVIALFVICI